MIKRILLFIISISLFGTIEAQIGGDHVYNFLNMSPSARVTGLGGSLITVKDDDVALAFNNPAVLNQLMHQQITFNHNIHLAGINNGYAAYGHYIKKWDATFHGGIQYVTYGDFVAANEFGDITGSFKASEYALTLGGAKQLYDKLSVGANLKLISSQLESFNSFGISSDFGAFYQDTSSNTSIALVFKNVGLQLSTYDEGNRETIPFEIQFGISKRLRYLPFRFSIVAHNLQRWNLTFDDPNSRETTFLFGDGQESDNAFGDWVDNFFRHFIFSGEFLFGKKDNFRLRFAYNHFRKQELSVDNARSLAGFSMGIGFKISRFRIEYGRSFYHIAGGLNHFSISTNLREFRK